LAYNLSNPNSVFVGTGRLYVNGTDVGLLQGEVVFEYEPEFNEIKGGSPEQIIKKALVSETATLRANMLELDPDKIALFMQMFTKETESSGDEVVTDEYLGEIYSGQYTAADYAPWTMDTVTVQLASRVSAEAAAGQASVYVMDASLFSEGDSVTLLEGAQTETLTIATGGVDTTSNKLTFTTNLSATYTIDAIAINETVSLAEGTDYILDRIGGKVSRVSTSAKVADGDTVSISYTYTAVSSTVLHFGGKTSQTYFPIKFVSDERDDGKRYYVEFYNALFSGTFSTTFSPSDPVVLEVEVTASPDSSKTDGKQLGKWYLA
jgi:hypothetical protein